MSFGFSVNGASGEIWNERKDHQIERELIDLNLYEVTVTPIPAYRNTQVGVYDERGKQHISPMAVKERMKAKLKLVQKAG